MFHVSAQGVDGRMINVHYYYYLTFLKLFIIITICDYFPGCFFLSLFPLVLVFMLLCLIYC